MKKKVIIMADDLKLCKVIKYSLQSKTIDEMMKILQELEPNANYMEVLLSAKAGFEQFAKHQFCLIILDIQLSETDEESFLEQLRKMNSMSILVHFTKNSSEAKIEIFNQSIGLVINPCKRTVEIKRQEILLTKREFDILYLLAGNPGVVFSKEQIYAIIWGEQFVKDDSNIMSYIGRLRKKMGEAGKYIQTVWGIGYRFADEGEEQ